MSRKSAKDKKLFQTSQDDEELQRENKKSKTVKSRLRSPKSNYSPAKSPASSKKLSNKMSASNVTVGEEFDALLKSNSDSSEEELDDLYNGKLIVYMFYLLYKLNIQMLIILQSIN